MEGDASTRLGPAIQEFRTNCPKDFKYGIGTGVLGLVIVLLSLINELRGFPPFFGYFCAGVGLYLVLSSLLEKGNRIVICEHGLLQQYRWRREAYLWSNVLAIEALKETHYSSGLGVGVTYSASIRLKDGSVRNLTSIVLNREVIQHIQEMIMRAHPEQIQVDSGEKGS